MTTPADAPTAPLAPGPGERWRRARWWVALGTALAAITLVQALVSSGAGRTPLATDNPAPDGARAAARILAAQGVDVRPVDRVSQLRRALGEAGGTVLVADPEGLLTGQALSSLGTVRADLVLVAPTQPLLDRLAPGVAARGAVTEAAAGRTARVAAGCADPDGRAAGSIIPGGRLYSLDPAAVAAPGSAEVCFVQPYSVRRGRPLSDPGWGATATLVRDGRRVTVFGAVPALTNEHLAEAGDAALALRTLGRHERLVWYLPAPDDPALLAGRATRPLLDVLPRWVVPAALWGLVVLAAAMVWRGRRFGPLVAEPLPVVVPAAETAEGRARLYRRHGARGRAALALRTGTVGRLAAALRLPRAAPAEEVVRAVAGATGRPEAALREMLLVSRPVDDRELARLAARLIELEEEVRAL